MALLSIYVIFFFVFFGQSLAYLKVIPHPVLLTTELAIYFLFLYSVISTKKDNRSYHFHLFVLVAFFSIITFCSVFFNQPLDVGIIVSFRRIFRFYIFYVALINMGLDDRTMKKINMLLFVLFILQIPAATAKLCVYGVHERVQGTYQMGSEGKTTMMIPIIALGYLAGYYFYYNRRRVYVLLAIGFIFFAVVSAKAAHLFLMPLTFMGLYYLIFIKGKRINFFKQVILFAFVVCFSIAVGAAVMKFQPRLNPEHKEGGSISLFHALDYSKRYTTDQLEISNQLYAGGRFATLMLTFHEVWKGGIGRILFGYGPGSTTGSRLETEINEETFRIVRSYGTTGFTLLLAEYGILGVFVFVLMFVIFARMSLKWFNCEEEPYWKAFATGSVVFAFLNLACFLGYSTVPIIGDISPPLFYYAMALTYLRLNKIREANALRIVR